MKKYICDRCGKECSNEHFMRLEEAAAPPFRIFSKIRNYDLCKECSDYIESLMKNKPTRDTGIME